MRSLTWRRSGAKQTASRSEAEIFYIVETGHSDPFEWGEVPHVPPSLTNSQSAAFSHPDCGNYRSAIFFHQHTSTFSLLRQTDPPAESEDMSPGKTELTTKQ